MTILLAVSPAIAQELFFGIVPHLIATKFELFWLVTRVLLSAILLWVVIQGIRRQGLEGWLVLPAVLLRGIGTFSNELQVLRAPISFHIFGVIFGLHTTTNLLLVAALSVLLLRRLLRSRKAQRLVALEQGERFTVARRGKVIAEIAPRRRQSHQSLRT